MNLIQILFAPVVFLLGFAVGMSYQETKVEQSKLYTPPPAPVMSTPAPGSWMFDPNRRNPLGRNEK